MPPLISAIVIGWSGTKARIEDALPVDNVLLHIVVGYAIYWSTVCILKGRRAPLIGFLLVVAATVANEAIDLSVEHWPDPWEQWGQSAQDFWWTLALPAFALLLTRETRPLRGDEASEPL